MTKEELRKEISALVSALQKEGKIHLASVIDKNWDKTVLEYSKEINSWNPERSLEPELLDAFNKELERLEFDTNSRKKILSSIGKRRVLQTAPHLVATEGPRMLCINWLGSLGVSENEFYVVGMFSGIPFSNNSRPGRINRKENGVNLFPSTLQNALVYKSKIPEKLPENFSKLPGKLKKLFPPAIVDASYTKWALQACQQIESKILNRNNLIYVDINEVVANYLVKVLRNNSHILHKILFNPETRKEFMKTFPNEIVFYTPVQNGKYEEMENMFFSEKGLKSKNREIILKDPEILIKEIEKNRVCPSLILTFIALSFLNQFKCFGSFAQVEYLPVYQGKLAKLKSMKKFKIEAVPTSNLTTGVFPNDTDAFPADLLIQDKNLEPKESWFFGELLLPIKDILIASYFTGDNKKNDKK